MDSVFEKITLYDILGYLFPGCILMLILMYAEKDQLLTSLVQWEDHTGILCVTFILISYLFGMALSELMRLISRIPKAVHLRSRNQEELPENKTGRWSGKEEMKAQVARAFAAYGIYADETEAREKIEADSEGWHSRYMYGCIQTDANYKRIHNYASALVMYKNLAGALFTGGLVCLFLLNPAEHLFGFVLCFILGFLFYMRYLRFQKKQKQYVAMWFVDKYLLSAKKDKDI